jgi:hypothetical protein
MGELLLHFPDSTHATSPGVLRFPQIMVCLDCGAWQFAMREEALRQLQEGTARSEAA